MRKRDYQRSRVYKAEYSIGQGKLFYSVKGIQIYIEKFVESKWFKEKFGNKCIIAYEQKKAKYACAYLSKKNIGEIWIPRDMFSELTVIHELTHIVTPLDVPDHGEAFTSNYIEIVGKLMGKKKERQLRKSFEENKVRFKDRK